MRSFEDYQPGAVEILGEVVLTREDIVAFASRYDAQPMHVDEEAARQTIAGGLIASGWHSCSLMMRLLADHNLNGAKSLGAPGVEEVRWLRPVRPGSRLRLRQEVLEARTSRSRPTVGLVRFRFTLLADDAEVAVEQTNWIMFGRRDADPPAPAASVTVDLAIDPDRPAATPGSGDPFGMGYLKDIAIGTMTELGSYRFEAPDIVAFARAFDPQPFHLDPDAASRSLFGGLCASGWHTAAIWMKLMVASRQRAAEAGVTAKLGPSPGFKNLVWSRPVFAGDTVGYRSTIVDRRPSASRPGWGLAFHRNEGINQRGEVVFSFDGCVLWEWGG